MACTNTSAYTFVHVSLAISADVHAIACAPFLYPNILHLSILWDIF